MGGYALSGAPGRQKKEDRNAAVRLFQSLTCANPMQRPALPGRLISPGSQPMTSTEKLPQVKQPPGRDLCQASAITTFSATSGSGDQRRRSDPAGGEGKDSGGRPKPLGDFRGIGCAGSPARQRISIDRRPMLVDRSSRLTADTACSCLDQDKLELARAAPGWSTSTIEPAGGPGRLVRRPWRP